MSRTGSEQSSAAGRSGGDGGREEREKENKKSQKMLRGLTVLDTRAGWDEKHSRRETVGQKKIRPWTRPELQPADERENKEEDMVGAGKETTIKQH